MKKLLMLAAAIAIAMAPLFFAVAETMAARYDFYEIVWTGSPGMPYVGSYELSMPGEFPSVVGVSGVFSSGPDSRVVAFSAPRGSSIAATLTGHPNLGNPRWGQVSILKNGIVCDFWNLWAPDRTSEITIRVGAKCPRVAQ